MGKLKKSYLESARSISTVTNYEKREEEQEVLKTKKKATTAPKFNLSTAVCVGATVGGNKSVSS